MAKDNAIALDDALSIRPQPDQYLLDEPLQKAVEMALRFNQPLLLTGDPGTGKTQLAYKVAYQLHQQTKKNAALRFGEHPLRFNTKTTSQARDLFYIYDAIGHFQQANNKELSGENRLPTAEFIALQALGQAIVNANPKPEYTGYFKYQPTENNQPFSSVVLVDEVDKAPRDFTNDILNELENREFFVREQNNYHVGLDLGLTDEEGQPRKNTQRILLIMTSNSEKNLPEAFLRRCVFYHIPTPVGEKLRSILKLHLHPDTSQQESLDENLEKITDEFARICEKVTRKAPATAELVAFIKILEAEGVLSKSIKDVKTHFKDNITLLIKTKEDLKALENFF